MHYSILYVGIHVVCVHGCTHVLSMWEYAHACVHMPLEAPNTCWMSHHPSPLSLFMQGLWLNAVLPDSAN